jgi:hypothetical protein
MVRLFSCDVVYSNVRRGIYTPVGVSVISLTLYTLSLVDQRVHRGALAFLLYLINKAAKNG